MTSFGLKLVKALQILKKFLILPTQNSGGVAQLVRASDS